MTQLTTTPDKQKSDFLSQPLLGALQLDWEKTIYLIFILLAIVTRFWGLGSRVMSHDESLHTQFSYQYYNGDGYSHTPMMHGPSLFHATAVAYWLFGASDYTSRAPVAVLGILLIAIPYLLRNWLGRYGALFTSFFLLISPYITYYSRYIRHDIYIISSALIVFISAWYYLHKREEKYLWWFALGNALMFTTMEASFIYVAIFGSFLVMRLLSQIVITPWLPQQLGRLRLPLVVVVLGILLLLGGYLGQKFAGNGESSTVLPASTSEGFAADPNAAQSTSATAEEGPNLTRWLQIVGLGIASAGLFLVASKLRSRLDSYPEFDLIILFSTLILPSVSPFLTEIAGWNPRDYSVNTCLLEGQETMSALQILVARAGNGLCWSSFFQSGFVHSSIFLAIAFAAAILVGLWWDKRRWLIAAAIFHAIFLVLFTSMFTNASGWFSGMIGSLGYWLEQQGVQRGSQPTFYYFFVTPFYEFLPLVFSLAALWLWLKQQWLSKAVGHLLLVVGLALLGYSLGNWVFNRSVVLTGGEMSYTPGWFIAIAVVVVGAAYWLFVGRYQAGGTVNLRQVLETQPLLGLLPFLAWWFVFTWVAYSVAGEKMPWLSTHFVIPMALMGGWYFNERLTAVADLKTLFTRPALLLLGVTGILIVAVFLALGPLVLGQIQFGNQQLNNLSGIGRFLGSMVVAGGLVYLWLKIYPQVAETAVRPIITFSIFILLSLLTIRFTYMANYINADYTSEYMVYAHGAPATKNTVMHQLEELSMRLHGDKSIRVAFDSDVAWPFTWYLRDYPNRVYFGDNPSQSLNDSPIIIVGQRNWGVVEPYLGRNYEYRDYTFLWWPMEDYRNISWNGIFGTPETGRGLSNPQVRQALWNIFFYRDYKKYGEVYGGTYTASEWPLRHPLRLYIRKDVASQLWDYGVGTVSLAAQVDPYAEKELFPQPLLTVNESGIASVNPGGLSAPRNLAVGADGRLYVADSGNHRIELFDQDGAFIQTWGQFGSEPGSFNEPWGIAVDEQFVYVADTWNHRIQKFTLDGELTAVFGQSGSPSAEAEGDELGLFFGPRSIILLPNNQLLVTDTGNHRLQILDREGNFLRQAGSFGNRLGQLNEPVGLAWGPDGMVYLADTWNGRIQRFNTDILPLFEWPIDAWVGQSINNKPYLAVDSAGRVYVTDPEGYRVLIFNGEGIYLGRFGAFGTGPGNFGLPNGIAVDSQDNIYIADAGNNRVLKFASPFGQSN